MSDIITLGQDGRHRARDHGSSAAGAGLRGCAGQPFSSGGVPCSAASDPRPAWTLGHETVFAERVGSSRGPQIVRLRTVDGTARAGSGYHALGQTVALRDGDDVPRAIAIPVRDNTVAGGDSAPVTTVDDAQRPDAGGIGTLPARVSWGGEVSGLAGAGRVREDRVNVIEATVSADATHQFHRDDPRGAPRDVRVRGKPVHPNPVCTASHGVGAGTGAAGRRPDAAPRRVGSRWSHVMR